MKKILCILVLFMITITGCCHVHCIKKSKYQRYECIIDAYQNGILIERLIEISLEPQNSYSYDGIYYRCVYCVSVKE